MSDNSIASEVLALNQRLLEAIAAADWPVYESLCSPDLTCFEPEALGHLVEGMAFHKFYFELGAGSGMRTVTMATPHVRLLGEDAAILSYTRLVQRAGSDGVPTTKRVEETRVWQRIDRTWKLVHVHRSAPC